MTRRRLYQTVALVLGATYAILGIIGVPGVAFAIIAIVAGLVFGLIAIFGAGRDGGS